ncbi:MAG: penicillin-binding transpeptidase domain-containing protein [Candidatus Methylacidiphilales bacterium]|nr:penicillin-binding transpeptidase domain-containing protein [Candidatus Methylacidiphilales bacterium]
MLDVSRQKCGGIVVAQQPSRIDVMQEARRIPVKTKRGILGWGLSGLLAVVGAFGAQAADPAVLVLTSTREDRAPHVEGPKERIDTGVCLASTFKVFLAWVALEEGLAGPDTRRVCTDAHVPGSPRELNLHQAMFYSSNDYFLQLFARFPQKKLDAYLLRSGLIGSTVPPGWLAASGRLVSGGGLLVSPAANHEFMRRVAFGQLASSPAVQLDLEAVMRWPGPGGGKAPVFYGKTGVYGGAVWFNGFADEGTRRVCTVQLPGSVAERPRAVAAFYRQWGLLWEPSWQDWLEPRPKGP